MAKKDKICIVCGEGFKGTEKAEVCGATCRKKLQRLKAAGKKPEYTLVGGKNSKVSFKPIEEPQSKAFKKQTSTIYDTHEIAAEGKDEPPKTTKPIDRMNNTFWNELRRKKLGLK
jgi:hypothetical protein